MTKDPTKASQQVQYGSIDELPSAPPIGNDIKALSDAEIERRAAADPDAGQLPADFWDKADEWPRAEDWAHSLAEAARLMPLVAAGGLRLEVTLPPRLATLILEGIARKDFLTPDEAVRVMLDEYRELMSHPDLRRELLRRSIGEAMDDPAPSIPIEEVFAQLKALKDAPRPKPAVWTVEAPRSVDE